MALSESAMPDVWGELYRDHWRGIVEPHVIERDDGREHQFESAADYFLAPRSAAEAQFLALLNGPGVNPTKWTQRGRWIDLP